MDDITYIVIQEKVEENHNCLAPITTYEIPNRDNFKCPHHPDYKIDALYMNNDSDTLCLCCIKCFIEDPELTRKYKILPLKDLFVSCVEVPIPIIRIDDDVEEEVEGTLMEVMIKDYGKQYNQHYESQLNMITGEIDQLIVGLGKLKAKYSNKIMSGKAEMEAIEEEIRRRIHPSRSHVQGSESRKYGSINDIYTKLGTLHTKEQTRMFFKEIYDKAKMSLIDARDIRKEKTVKRMIEDFKEKVGKLKDQEFDMSTFKGKKYTGYI